MSPKTMHMPRPTLRALLLIASLLGGCANAGNPKDPLEPLNRNIYEFNRVVDNVALKPVAKGYKAAVPPPVRGGVNNFFGNFRDVTTAVNNLLQLKLNKALSDVGRVALNSTVGLFGVFDVATRLGLDRHDEDFGQTLGYWGVQDGPFLMLPFLGPSTARDTVGLIGDYLTDPEFYLIEGSPENWLVFGTRVVSVRANLLEADRLLDQAAIDRYAFLRDAYLQRRHSLIHDGDHPPGGGEGSRKSLKELEEELGVDEPPTTDGAASEHAKQPDNGAAPTEAPDKSENPPQ
jgi:phospholipid-binding lipoprotein MlaA